MKNCEYCGKLFKPARAQQRFCGLSCSGHASNRNRATRYKGKAVIEKSVVDEYQAGKSSREIAKASGTNHSTVLDILRRRGIAIRNRSSSQTGKPKPFRGAKKPHPAKTCEICGKSFRKSKPSHTAKARFCSMACAQEFNRRSNPKPPRPSLICEQCGKTYAPNFLYETVLRRFCSHACSLRWKATNQPETGIERTVRAWVKSAGIRFTTRGNIHKFIPDLLLVDAPVVIECDGEYWHSLPDIVRRDQMRDAVMMRAGYHVVRLWGTDIQTNRKHCLDLIGAALRHARNGGKPATLFSAHHLRKEP